MGLDASVAQSRISSAQARAVETRQQVGDSLYYFSSDKIRGFARKIPDLKSPAASLGHRESRRPATEISYALAAGNLPALGTFEDPKILTFNNNEVKATPNQVSVSQEASSLLTLNVLFGALKPEASPIIAKNVELVKSGVLHV